MLGFLVNNKKMKEHFGVVQVSKIVNLLFYQLQYDQIQRVALMQILERSTEDTC